MAVIYDAPVLYDAHLRYDGLEGARRVHLSGPQLTTRSHGPKKSVHVSEDES